MKTFTVCMHLCTPCTLNSHPLALYGAGGGSRHSAISWRGHTVGSWRHLGGNSTCHRDLEGAAAVVCFLSLFTLPTCIGTYPEAVHASRAPA
jgi:hypothetical protein